MQLENGFFQLALAHTVSRLGLLNTHQNSTASSGGRKMQKNPEAAASLVAVTALMKAHPRRRSARQAIQRFWKDSHSSFPPWSCSMLQKAQNAQRLYPSQGSLKCLDYTVLLHGFCTCLSFPSTPHPQQSDRNHLFPHTSLFCVGYRQQGRLQQEGPACQYEGSTKEMLLLCFHQHLQRGSRSRELEGQAGWGMQE